MKETQLFLMAVAGAASALAQDGSEGGAAT
jgi:hypothetical protein